MVYFGETKNGKAYGKGTLYYPNGKIYQEGYFGIKGLINGREYYPNGAIRYEAIFWINRGYGPNLPALGNFYGKNGVLIYSGRSKFHFGGVGYSIIEEPKGFGLFGSLRVPAFHPYMWRDEKHSTD